MSKINIDTHTTIKVSELDKNTILLNYQKEELFFSIKLDKEDARKLAIYIKNLI